MRYARLLVLLGGILLHVCAANAAGRPHRQSSYFPLAEGNSWTYSVYSSLLDSVIRIETFQIDDMVSDRGTSYYHLTIPWPPFGSAWVHVDAGGDLYWSDYPGQPEHPLMLFSAGLDEGWLLGGQFCVDSVRRMHCPDASASQAESDDVICFACAWRPGDCYDACWSGAFEAGVGPVLWRAVGVGGIYLEWDLVEFRPGRPTCDCKCHADPLCDGALDVLDLILAIDVAFCGMTPPTHHGCWCYAHAMNGLTDVDCSGATDIIDISKIADVIFAGADPAKEFCDPGQP